MVEGVCVYCEYAGIAEWVMMEYESGRDCTRLNRYMAENECCRRAHHCARYLVALVEMYSHKHKCYYVNGHGIRHSHIVTPVAAVVQHSKDSQQWRQIHLVAQG